MMHYELENNMEEVSHDLFWGSPVFIPREWEP
jgi:hypothetical protein